MAYPNLKQHCLEVPKAGLKIFNNLGVLEVVDHLHAWQGSLRSLFTVEKFSSVY